MSIQEMMEEIELIKRLIAIGQVTPQEQTKLETALVALQDSLIHRLTIELEYYNSAKAA